MMAGLLSTLTALIVPPSMVGVPGWVYAMLGPVMPIYGVWMNRRRLAVIRKAGGELPDRPR